MQQIIGAKKGQQASKPYIMPDNMQSGNEVGIIYGLGEGEILGLVDGGKSIYLDGTPLINDNGGENFGGVSWEMRTGTIDQTHLYGFPAVENETSVNVELRHDRAFVRQIRNTKLSAVVIRLGFGAIFTAKDNGDRVGHTIEYAVDVQTDGGVWREVLATKFSGKASQGYKRSHRIDLPTAKSNWTIRVRRLTANKDSEMVGDRMTIDALTEVIDAKLRYPCTALIGLRFNAESFNNIPKFAAECHGMIIQVPTNYDPVARTYAGLWDGTFKLAYSNNPAWIYYDLCTARRYALGDRLVGHLDKWSLYRVAQYCDEMVDDGRGGREPRYACNVYLQQREDAYKILQNIAGIFHALTYWDGEQIIVDADLPKDVLYTFSRANIIGDFEYSGTANYARHTQIKVAYDDPDNEYKTAYEIVPDLQAIAKYGVKTLDMSALGCTSQAQAIRLGKWALLSEALETQTVTFSVGLDGYLPHVGSVIAVSDHVLAGRGNGGRVQAIDGNIITLDRSVAKPLASGDMFMINGNDGVTETRTITAINGNKITVQTAFERAEVDAVWAMDSADLQTLKLRVMSIVQSEPAKFTITGVEYNPDKFAAAEIDIRALPKPVSVIPTAVISAPETVTISQSVRVEQGVSITKLSIDWSQVIGAVAYRVEWRKDDSDTWIALPKTASQSIDIDNVYSGNYQARVRAIDAFDNESLATTSQLTQITGKIGKPPRLASLKVVGILFGMEMGWSFNKGSEDTNFTEIQVSTDGRSNIATLGTFAYPTDKHTINGLQGNLTQFYRARIVDKLGNTSDWTAWTSGTTSADADKVLELLQGQITASQLHQDLSAPIGKISTLESAINAVNSQLPTLNGQIATLNSKATSLQNELNTAKSTLQTAVGNITTERNRITSAIRDITALQTANNAKTAELANLSQTVGGHTSSIRDLAVTTGELSQRYTQLKTASDNANAEIASIKQTQAGQATQINQMSARFAVRPNLCPDVDKWTLGYAFYTDKSSDWGMMLKTHANDTRVSLSPKIPVRAGGVYVLSYDSLRYCDGGWVYCDLQGYNAQGQQVWDSDQVSRSDRHDFATDNRNRDFNAIQYTIPQDVTHVQVRFVAQGITGNTAVGVRQVKFEYGALPASMYSQEADVAGLTQSQAQTQANIDEFKRTEALANGALSQRIDSIDTTYKRADTQANARIDSEISARTTADTALSQRIDSLSSDYQGNKASVASQLQTLANADGSTAQRLESLNASFSDINARSKIRVNLLPNGGFENGLTGWSSNTDFVLEEHPSFGRLAVISNITNKTGTFTLVSDKMHCEAGRTYVISCDTASHARTCRVYCDLLFYNAQNQVILDGNQSPIEHNHDYAVVQNRHEAATQAPQGAVYMSARFVAENLTGGLHVGVRQIKVEVGHLPSTQYTADTLGKSLTASINEVKQTIATQNQAMASQISTLQTTMQGQTASIQQHAQSLNGLSAQWTLKVQSGNIVSGIGLANNNGVSDFAIRADKFYVAPPTGTTKQPLFSVLTTATTIDGVSVPAGVYLSDGYIQNGAITNAKIANGAINSAKIGNAVIDTAHIKNGSIGSLQLKDGSVTSAKIGHAQVDTLQIAGEAVIIPRVQFTPSQFDFYSIDTEEEINRITLDPRGGAVAISFGFERLYARAGGNNDGMGGRVILRIKRSGTVLRTLSFTKTGQVVWYSERRGDDYYTVYQAEILASWITLPTLLDKPPEGEQVYTVTLESRGLNAGKNSSQQATYPVSITARSLQVMGVKR